MLAVHAGYSPGDSLSRKEVEARERIDGLENCRNTLKRQRTAYDVTATMGKKYDRKMRVKQFSDYCNKELIGQHSHGKKHFRFRAEESVFYVKRDYSVGFCADDSDLEELSIYCENYSENVKELQVGVDSPKKKVLREIEEEYFGAGRGSLPEYKKIFLYVALYIIARFEQTRVVKIVRTYEQWRVRVDLLTGLALMAYIYATIGK